MHMDMDATITPDAQYVTGVMDMEAMGESSSQNMDMYVEPKENKAWYNMEDEWYVLDMETAYTLSGMSPTEMTSISADPTDYANIELREEENEYIIVADVDEGMFSKLLGDSMSDMTGSEVEKMQEMFKDIKFRSEMHYDKETKELKKSIVEMLDPLEMTEESEGMEMKMVVQPMTITMTVHAIGDAVADVEIPEDVKTNALEMDDMMDIDAEHAD